MFGYKVNNQEMGSSSDPCSEEYHGESAFSEPETQSVRDFILARQTFLKTVLNFHAYDIISIRDEKLF